MTFAAATLGCGQAEPVELGESSQAIIDGEPSTDDENAVVLFVSASGQGIGQCTATLVAPNVVLTARHCVAQTDLYSVCDENGRALQGGRVQRDFDADDFFIFLGKDRPRFERGERPDPAGRGRALFVPDTKVLCDADIALVVLENDVADAMIAPMRLDTPVVPGETVTSVGWGLTESGSSPSVRQRREGVEVEAIGPKTSRGSAVAAGEFEVGESICSGDSGGPAFATETGAVLGVVSRGGNGREGGNPATGCIGNATFNLYTTVGAHRDMVLAAFEEAGATPWLEGEPNPLLAEFGETCDVGDDCQSGICIDDKAGPVCSQACGAAEACPSGFTCKTDDKVCMAEEPEEESGCSVAAPGRETTALGVVLGLGTMLGLSLRRRARRPR